MREEDSMEGTKKIAVDVLVGEREGIEGERIGVLKESREGEIE